MKKGNKLFTLVSSLLLGTNILQAQSGLETANKQYESLAYSESIKNYEKVSRRGYVSEELLKNFGNSYYFNGEYRAAYVWYYKLFTEFDTTSIDSEYLYRYAQTLLNVGEKDKAQIYFEKFASVNPNSLRAKLILSDIKSIMDRKESRYTIKRSAINSRFTDYPNTMYDGNLIFTSARDTGSFRKRISLWTGDPMTKLYQAPIGESGELGKSSLLSSTIDSKYNESGATITKDGKTIYFTRNNYIKGRRGISSNFETLLKIYRAEWIDDEWTNITELPFNSDQFSTAHPVLSPDEDVLYFASDRPGGYGNSDLWRVKIIGTGFGIPENLGDSINTDGRETFPFITPNNELYFSSDARPGFGGLDVYAVKIKEDGSLSKVFNLGEPINSAYDDFAYVIDYNTKQGFFASNRKGTKGKDDMYAFIENIPLEFECIQKLKVTVMDAQTRNILTNVKLQLFDLEGKLLAHSTPFDACNHIFDYKQDCGISYKIKVEAPEYVVKEEIVTTGTESGETEVIVLVEKKVAKIEIKKDDDLFKKLNLAPIHFDLDKSDIRPDAAIELNKIVEIMKEYPKMKIHIRAHTDSRGPSKYNVKLSGQRALSTAQWIVDQGISPYRVSYNGYGDTQLLNDCAKGVDCTEEQHNENRRSEFIVK